MASFASSLALSLSPPRLRPPLPRLRFLSSSSIPASRSFRPSPGARRPGRPLSIRATQDFSDSIEDEEGNGKEQDGPSAGVATLGFSGSFFEDGDEENEENEEEEDDGWVGVSASVAYAAIFGSGEDKPEIECPPGLRAYETMIVLRPDMTEEQRLALVQRYEELLVAGGAMYVEVFNRGVLPLEYCIKTKNKDGETLMFYDGLYTLFTYFNKPESIAALTSRLNFDYDVIRHSTSRIRNQYF